MRRRRAARLAAAALAAWAALIAAHFPYATDRPLSEAETAEARRYYTAAYDGGPSGELTAEESEYVRKARSSYAYYKVGERLESFIKERGLGRGRGLEVGAGQGLLQEAIADYTGLDIAASSSRYFHKPFVAGSATALPFPDNSFDVVWTVQTLEHVPNPEQALREMRRVTRDGGYIYMMVAWNCEPWYAQGYEVRPYRDFDWKGKLVKASVPLRSSAPFRALHVFPLRGLRAAAYGLGAGPMTLRYRRLEPNYKQYWVADSDAVNGIDRQEVYLWHASRGDECLNCRPPWQYAFRRSGDGRLLIRVRKRGAA